MLSDTNINSIQLFNSLGVDNYLLPILNIPQLRRVPVIFIESGCLNCKRYNSSNGY